MTRRPFAITLDPGSSLANHTGSWRLERPVYVDSMPPCSQACPAGERIREWLAPAEEGGYEAAWRLLVEDNPLPAIMGRVCFHPCETACNRVQLDVAVGINSIERFLGDEALRQGWRLTVTAAPTGRHVLVVGSGPSGLSAAYQLRRLGHDVTIVDSEALPGGMMRYGIPRYRLPRDVLDAEIQRILDAGVRLVLRHRVTDIEREMTDRHADAVFLAVGAHIAKRTYIPAGDSARILDAVSLLHDLEGEEPPRLGRRVVVYGGGDTAMDAARTARRLGAADAIVVYRRTRERMPAHAEEVEGARDEGIRMRWLSTIRSVDQGRLIVEHMVLDESGLPQPTGELEELGADTVVLALGQEADLSLLHDDPGIVVDDGVVDVAASMMTGHPGVFAGGDMVPGDRTVTLAIGHGSRAAAGIHAWLRGASAAGPVPERPVATFEALNTWYYADAPRTVRPQLERARRTSTFDEVVQGLGEHTALFEARRCLSCGACFECDNCYGVCPDNAVVKLGPGLKYEIDYDYCKGCGLCAAECPSGAIAMVPETI